MHYSTPYYTRLAILHSFNICRYKKGILGSRRLSDQGEAYVLAAVRIASLIHRYKLEVRPREYGVDEEKYRECLAELAKEYL